MKRLRLSLLALLCCCLACAPAPEQAVSLAVGAKVIAESEAPLAGVKVLFRTGQDAGWTLLGRSDANGRISIAHTVSKSAASNPLKLRLQKRRFQSAEFSARLHSLPVVDGRRQWVLGIVRLRPQ